MKYLALAAVLVASRAEADTTKAWAAAKAHAPAQTQMLVGANVATLAQSSLIGYVRTMIASSREISAVHDVIAKECKFDILKVVDGVVFAGDDSGGGATFVQLRGIDETPVLACFDKVAKKIGASKVTIARDGDVTSVSGGQEPIHLRWLAPDLVAFASKSSDRAMLDAWTGGNGALAKTSVMKLAAKASTNAALWMVRVKELKLEQFTARSGRATVDLAGGTLTLAMNATFGSAKDATGAAKLANEQITKLMMNGALDASLLELLKQVKVAAKGSELTVGAAAPEADIVELIAAVLGSK